MGEFFTYILEMVEKILAYINDFDFAIIDWLKELFANF